MKTRNISPSIIRLLIQATMANLASALLLFTFLTAAAIIPSLTSAQNASNNNKNGLADIIENGYGDIIVRNSETNNRVPNATVILTPISIPGDSVPDPYTYITPTNGLINYEVLTFADFDVSVPEAFQEQIQTVRPNPSSDFTINYYSQELPSSLIISDIQGRMVTEINGQLDRSNKIAEFYVDLSPQAKGVYFASSIIDGVRHTEKLVKINSVVSGKQTIQNINKSSTTTTLEDAIYQVDITADDYEPYVGEISVATGANNISLRIIDPVAGPPQHQDLTGRVYLQDDNNDINIAVGATVYVTNTSTGQTLSTPTDANGDWMINNFPLDKTAEVSFEYNNEHYAIEDVYYTTPEYDENTWTASDTIHENLNALLPTKREGTSAVHIGQHAGRGTILDDIQIYFNGVDETYEQIVLADLTNFTNETPGLYNLIVSDTPVGDNGITISNDGVNTTTPIDGAYETPWNHVLAYTSGANTSISSPGNFLVTGHEFLRGVGHDGVGFYSIMEASAPAYTEEDRTIQDIGRYYHNAAYHDQIHAIQITKLVEEIDSKKKENATVQKIGNINYHFTN